MKLEDMTEVELDGLMRDCARAINTKLVAHLQGEKPMFVLLVFNDPGAAQYISTCERSGVIQALREAADRLENKQDVPR